VATTEIEDHHVLLTVYGRKPRNSAKTATACRLVTVLAESAQRDGQEVPWHPYTTRQERPR